MERPRNSRPEIATAPVIDFGISSTPDRRCKTCACFLEYNPTGAVGQTQAVCRRDPAGLMMTRNAITGNTDTGLAYKPTQGDLVCFDGWRPLYTPPGIPAALPILTLPLPMEKA